MTAPRLDARRAAFCPTCGRCVAVTTAVRLRVHRDRKTNAGCPASGDTVGPSRTAPTPPTPKTT